MLRYFWPDGLQLAICAALIAAAPWISPVFAQTTAEKDNLSVEQALAVANGLGALVKAQTTDKDGKPVDVTDKDGKPIYFQFSGDVRMIMAINIDLGRKVQTQFERALNDVRMQLSEGSGTVPDDKRGKFNAELTKLADAPSRVGFYHIKLKDLCLEAKPPECQVGNPIPAPTLSLILPIIDR